MYKNQFDKEFASNFPYYGYMFYGGSDYLVETYAENVSKKLANGEDIQKIYYDEYNFKDCSNFISQSSLFSPCNILLIKTNKKIPKKEVDDLLGICQINTDSKVIFCCTGDNDFRTMAKSFGKKTNSAEVRFFEPNEQEAINLLNMEAKTLQLHCGFGELQYLYSMHQKDLSLCVSDLKKLSLLDTPITVGIINSHCFGMGSVNIDEFFNKLFLGQNINRDLYMLLEEGMGEIQLINQTISFIQQLFTINSYIKLHGRLDVLDIWGYKLPQNIANQRASIATKFTKQEDFIRMLEHFQGLELELKTNSHLDVNSIVQSSFRNFSVSLR